MSFIYFTCYKPNLTHPQVNKFWIRCWWGVEIEEAIPPSYRTVAYRFIGKKVSRLWYLAMLKSELSSFFLSFSYS